MYLNDEMMFQNPFNEIEKQRNEMEDIFKTLILSTVVLKTIKMMCAPLSEKKTVFFGIVPNTKSSLFFFLKNS